MAESKSLRRVDNLVAGGSAGLLESLVTYPTEYVKTRQQLSKISGASTSPFRIFMDTWRQPDGLASLYRGSAAFCSANSAKSGIRFFTFDAIRTLLPKDTITGKPTPTSNVLAGLVAGVAESITVVTPGETLKTKLIDAANVKNGPKFTGTFDAVRQIVSHEGPQGLYKGVVPVTLKQSSNAIVRFTSYGIFYDLLSSVVPDTSAAVKPIFAGALAGIVTVYATMPFDTIKTRLQSLGTGSAHLGTLSCCAQIVRTERMLALWRGATPRLVRLTMSGAISFSVYENVPRLLSSTKAASSIVPVAERSRIT